MDIQSILFVMSHKYVLFLPDFNRSRFFPTTQAEGKTGNSLVKLEKSIFPFKILQKNQKNVIFILPMYTHVTVVFAETRTYLTLKISLH